MKKPAGANFNRNTGKKPVYGQMTGAVSTDDGYQANKTASNLIPPQGKGAQVTVDSARSGSGMAPKPKATPPEQSSNHAPMNNFARVKNTGKGPQLGVTTKPTGPHPAGLQKGQAPQLSAAASQKPAKRTHPFFGSNDLGY